MADFWANDPVAQPKSNGPVFIPNEGAIASDRRDETRTGIAVEGNERSGRQESREASKDERDGVAKMRDAFLALPEVKKYNTIVSQADAALHTEATPAGDQRLMYSIVQMRDPLGSVREGDAALLEGGVPYIEQQLQKLRKNLNSEGMFPDEYRKQLKQEAVKGLNTANRAYTQYRRFYTDIANQSNYDPYLVVGPHAGAPYLERFREYDKANGLGEFSPEAIAKRAGQEYRPDKDEIALGMDLPGSQGMGVDVPRLAPAQEAQLAAYLNARRGDPNFRPEEYAAFAKSIGIEGDLALDPSLVEAVRKGGDIPTGIDYSGADERRRQEVEGLAKERYGEDYSSRASSMLKGFTLNLSDEMAGLVGGVSDLATGGDFGEGYARERDVERTVQKQSREDYGVGYELAGGIAMPLGWMKRPATVAEFAAQGGKLGAVAGFGEGEGVADTVSKTATGAGIGTIAGAGIGKAAPYIPGVVDKVSSGIGRMFPNAARGGEFADAAQRQGLDYLPADRPGAVVSQLATGVSKVTLGGIPLARQADKVIAKATARKDEIARAIGPVAGDTTAAGQAVKRGMSEWSAASLEKGGKLYDAIPISPASAADVTNTRGALAELTAGLSSNPALSDLTADATMKAYREALESGGLSWADLKKFRSFIGEKRGTAKFSDGSSKGDLDRLYGALSEDMRATAAANGPGALKAFTRANDYWRGRETRIENVSKVLFGDAADKSDSAAFNSLMSWAKKDTGDFKKLSVAMRSLPDEEASTIRATTLDRLGRATAGTQDDTQVRFSPSTFMTNWTNLDQRAKNILFQGEHRKAVDDFVKVMSGIKGSERFANTSKTGLPVSAAATVSALFSEPVTGAAMATGQLAMGRLLGSPTVAKWLSALFRKPNPQAALQHIERLESVARSQPVLANDIFTLQQRLAEAYAQPSALRAAAEENDPLGQRPPNEEEQANGPR
jgi:hypothetical protein